MKTVAIGIYGGNGHQIHKLLARNPMGKLVATAAFEPDGLPENLKADPQIRHYPGIDELLMDPRVELVSLCSPRRKDQAREAIRCLEAGKHVYAEKPCAMAESELDAILAAVARTGRRFQEMAGTAFEQPYLEMRQRIQAGVVGTVIQVLAQKSYPYFDRRPQDEDVDGGLLMQVGIHAFRFIEHVAGVRIKTVQAVETGLGNPKTGNLRMATSMLMTLENGGVASVIANYLNPSAFGQWGNESLRIFGTRGFIEAVDAGTRTRLVLNDKDHGAFPLKDPAPPTYLDLYLRSLLDPKQPMPLSLEEELHPTRMVIRAKANAGA